MKPQINPTPDTLAPPRPSLRQKLHHHGSRARETWKNYYHYKRLEAHGQPLPWHGVRGWMRVILTGLALAALLAYGFHRTL